MECSGGLLWNVQVLFLKHGGSHLCDPLHIYLSARLPPHTQFLHWLRDEFVEAGNKVRCRKQTLLKFILFIYF